MLLRATPTADAVDLRSLPISSPPQVMLGVTVLASPYDTVHRDALRVLGMPCLLLVPPQSPPPHDCGSSEDWVRLPADPGEVALRCRTLATRTGTGQATVLDDPARALSEQAVTRVLTTRLRVPISRAALRAVYVGAGGSTSLRRFETDLARCRREVAAHGVAVEALDGGFLLADAVS